MTRRRTEFNGIPNELHMEYYSQRAKNFGLVFTECTGIAPNGNCFPGCTEIYKQVHVEGWKKVTEKVKT